MRPREDSGQAFLVNTALPQEAFEVVDEDDGPGELGAGEAR